MCGPKLHHSLVLMYICKGPSSYTVIPIPCTMLDGECGEGGISKFLSVCQQCGVKSHGPFLTFELSSVRSSVPVLILRKYTKQTLFLRLFLSIHNVN